MFEFLVGVGIGIIISCGVVVLQEWKRRKLEGSNFIGGPLYACQEKCAQLHEFNSPAYNRCVSECIKATIPQHSPSDPQKS
jgi:hypothetical protein